MGTAAASGLLPLFSAGKGFRASFVLLPLDLFHVTMGSTLRLLGRQARPGGIGLGAGMGFGSGIGSAFLFGRLVQPPLRARDSTQHSTPAGHPAATEGDPWPSGHGAASTAVKSRPRPSRASSGFSTDVRDAAAPCGLCNCQPTRVAAGRFVWRDRSLYIPCRNYHDKGYLFAESFTFSPGCCTISSSRSSCAHSPKSASQPITVTSVGTRNLSHATPRRFRGRPERDRGRAAAGEGERTARAAAARARGRRAPPQRTACRAAQSRSARP